MMSTRRHKRTVVLMGLCLVIALSTGIQSVAAEQKLTLWESQLTEQKEVTEPLYKEFERKFNVKLEVTSILWFDSHKKYMIAGMSDTLPDVISFWGMGMTPWLAVNEKLLPLDDLIEDEGGQAFKDLYVEGLLARYNDKWYGLPQAGGVYCLFWNKTYFDEAGITGPPKTWDEYLDAAKKLTDPAKKRWGITFSGADTDALLNTGPYILQNRGRIGRVDGKIRLNERPAVEAIEWILDLVREHKVVTPGIVTITAPRARELFGTGQAAMLFEGGWTIPAIARMDPPFEWRIALLPKGKVTGSTSSAGDYAYGIPMTTTGEKRDLAWKFVKWICAEPQIRRWVYPTDLIAKAQTVNEQNLVKNPCIPGTKGTYEVEELLNDPYFAPFLEQVMTPGFTSQYMYMPAQLEDSLEIYKREMQEGLLGKKTAQQLADAVVKEWKGLFKTWEDKYGSFTR